MECCRSEEPGSLGEGPVLACLERGAQREAGARQQSHAGTRKLGVKSEQSQGRGTWRIRGDILSV